MASRQLTPRSAFTPSSWLFLALAVAGISAASAPACSAPGSGSNPDQQGPGGDTGVDDDVPLVGLDPIVTVDVPTDCPTSLCEIFPEEPILDAESPAPVTEADVALFGNDPENFSSGLCVSEPTLGIDGAPGALFPSNWLRPRFKWTASAGDSVYEIRLQAENQVHDLVAYTKGTTFKIPEDLWKELASAVHGTITVTIRGAGSGTISGMRGTFAIAPVEAGGSMVFWATNTKAITKTGSYLLSFPVGSESVVPALDLSQLVQQTGATTPRNERGVAWSHGDGLRGDGANSDYYKYRPEATDADKGLIQCIGCHVSTPDGSSVIFGDDWPWNKVAANVDPAQGEIGATPDWLTPVGEALLRLPFQGTPTMTESLWTEGKRLMVTSQAKLKDGKLYERNRVDDDGTWTSGGDLVWMNLGASAEDESLFRLTTGDSGIRDARQQAILDGEALSGEGPNTEGKFWGKLSLTGESFDSPVMPDWSHDGQSIAYTATTASDNGHPSKTDSNVDADIHVVPFNDGAGGTVRAVEGASTEGVLEYYPAFSQDDEWIAYNRAVGGSPYFNSKSEIYVVKSEGGTPLRLRANDPSACSVESSPGINNSWAKWSPNVITKEGKTYYFLVFSSSRQHEGQFELIDPGDDPTQFSAQLYMAAMVVDDATGEVTDYPAVYLWNQNQYVENGEAVTRMSSNLTPAWDNFNIPDPPPVTVVR